LLHGIFQVFDYALDSDSKEFTSWTNIISSYTSTPHCGIPNDAFVHTVTNGVSVCNDDLRSIQLRQAEFKILCSSIPVLTLNPHTPRI